MWDTHGSFGGDPAENFQEMGLNVSACIENIMIAVHEFPSPGRPALPSSDPGSIETVSHPSDEFPRHMRAQASPSRHRRQHGFHIHTVDRTLLADISGQKEVRLEYPHL
jgi:hypothetical protein